MMMPSASAVQPVQAPYPVTTAVQTPSYVAPPVQYTQAAPAVMAPAGIPIPAPPAPPGPPGKLTQGIPDPSQIEKQKGAYSAALDKQLQEAMETVRNETKIEKDMIAFKIKKDIALFETQVDEQLVEQMAAIDEMATFSQLELKKALVDRNIQLNAQASNLVSEYKMKALQDELARKKVEFEQNYVQKEVQLAQAYNKEAAMANTPTYAAVAPVTAAVAAPVMASVVPAPIATATVAAAPMTTVSAAPAMTAAAPVYTGATYAPATTVTAAPYTGYAAPQTAYAGYAAPQTTYAGYAAPQTTYTQLVA